MTVLLNASSTSIETSLDLRVANLAEQQSGTISRSQALALGASQSGIHRRLAAGRWIRRGQGVYVIAGVPQSWLRDIWCAYLAVGPTAVVSHETALRLHGIGCVPPRPLTFTIPHGGHTYIPRTFVHQIDDLRPDRVSTVAGLRTSSAPRAVVEVAATLGPKQLGRVLDEVRHLKLASFAQVGACLGEVMRPGKPGVVKLARILDERGDGYVPPASELERALFAALTAGGLPEPRRQVRLPGRGAIEGLVDAAYLDVRLIIEADGRRWHTRLADFRRDRQRDVEAARSGWQTLRFTYAEIVHDPTELCAAVRDVRAIRLRK